MLMPPSLLDQPLPPLQGTSIRSLGRVVLEYISLGASTLTPISMIASLFYLVQVIENGAFWLIVVAATGLVTALSMTIIHAHLQWRKATLKYEATQDGRFLRKVTFKTAIKSAALLSTFWVFSSLLIMGKLVELGATAFQDWTTWLLAALLLAHTLAAPVQLFYLEKIRKLQANKTGRSYQPIALLGKSDTSQSLGNSNYWA